MNVLSMEQKVSVISALVEGNSIRSTERMTGVHRDTIMRLVVRTGENCGRILDERMRGICSRFVQVDEIWTYVGIKEKRLTSEHDAFTQGDQYVFAADGLRDETDSVVRRRQAQRSELLLPYARSERAARNARAAHHRRIPALHQRRRG